MKNNNVKRRDFMKLLAGGGTAAALSSVGQLAVMSKASAADPGLPGYKALVCVFFLGGNDGFNMLIPSDASHADYAAIRAALAVKKNDLGLSSISSAMHNGTMGSGAANLYDVNKTQAKAYTKGFYDLSSKGMNIGVNGVMPEFAQLIHDNKLSVIANCGNMVAPVTRQEIKDGTAKLQLKLPLFLFAHNHQQRELQTGEAHRIGALGWAGKIADAWQGINNNSPIGLNISYSGNNRMLMGEKTSALVLSPGKPISFREMRPNTDSYNQERRALFQELIKIGKRASNFERLEATLLDRSQTNFEALATAWENNTIDYAAKGPYGEDLFSVPTPAQLSFNDKLSGAFIKRMDTVAKMVDMGAKDAFQTGNYQRQIFFVGVGGFDTHANQANSHSKLMRELSLGLWKFQKAMEELGHAEKVTTFSMSDFGRTLSVNAGLGTDHAWGSNHFVMGGAGSKTSGTLNGGKMFGTFPNLTPNGPDDYSDKGRMIPTTSQDQINASICEWFGVEQSLISELFPNLANFEKTQGDTKSAYLKDLFVS
ncbi:MAG: DUF1501 domain-containing protein [Cocleimonas sp.]|nr:DUF1501 domain-containing protein [Cocleimonas sp.]